MNSKIETQTEKYHLYEFINANVYAKYARYFTSEKESSRKGRIHSAAAAPAAPAHSAAAATSTAAAASTAPTAASRLPEIHHRLVDGRHNRASESTAPATTSTAAAATTTATVAAAHVSRRRVRASLGNRERSAAASLSRTAVDRRSSSPRSRWPQEKYHFRELYYDRLIKISAPVASTFIFASKAILTYNEREKDRIVSSRGQQETHYRSVSSEAPRIAKASASTAAPIVSKSYFSEPDQSYPYYTIYDDDVSIYKDDADYNQYALNASLSIPSPPPQHQFNRQQQQHQQHHQQQQNQHQQQQQQHQQHQQQHQQHHQQQQHQHQQQQQHQPPPPPPPPVNIRAEVSPSSKPFSIKPKKINVHEADKYNLNQDVTIQDYDIYDNQHLSKNKFRLSDGHSVRPNIISHPVVHVTTPNAIIDTFIPLTTTTQSPVTSPRSYSASAPPLRSRQQVNRGTAPPRLRPTLKPSTEIVSKAQEFVDIYRFPPQRPVNIYPTPTPDKPAAKCRKDVCLLPDCNCGGPDIPAGCQLRHHDQLWSIAHCCPRASGGENRQGGGRERKDSERDKNAALCSSFDETCFCFSSTVYNIQILTRRVTR
uniref:Uncharacterized protein n=1 Tax=Trichogramma kaykai TaxID=54128 RepID=A0ABD2XCI8_9HYME